MQYGKQYVPVSADDEAYLAYKPERGIHLLGFMPTENIPQYQYLKAGTITSSSVSLVEYIHVMACTVR